MKVKVANGVGPARGWVELELDENARIRQVKETAGREFQLARQEVNSSVLSFNGQNLGDNMTLKDAGVGDGMELKMLPRNVEGGL